MKIVSTSKIATLVAVLLSLFATAKLKAQPTCPYVITNSLTCPVSVLWTITSSASGCQAGCISGGSGTIAPGGTYVITCATFATCSNVCGMKVSVMTVANTTLASPISAFAPMGGFPASNSGTGAGACPSVNLMVNTGGALIN